MGNPHRRVILLGAVDPVREVIVGRDAVELSGRLIVIRAPAFAAAEADLGAAVVADDHALGRGRVDPQIVMVAVGSADHAEVSSAVLGVPEQDVDDVDVVGILRPGVNARVIPGPLAQFARLIDLGPGLARVVRAKDTAVLSLDDGPDTIRIDRRNRQADDADDPLRQALVAGDLFPRVAAVGALPDTGPRSAALQAVGRAFHPPRRRINDARIVRVESQFERADFVVDEENLFPGEAAVTAAKDAALLVGAVQVAQRRDVEEVWILRMHADARNVVGIAQADGFPGLAGIGRFPHAAAVGHVAAHGLLAAAGIDDIGIRLADGDGADGAAEEAVADILPGGAAVIGPPHAAAGAAEIEQPRFARHARHCRGAAPAERPDLAIAQ